MVSTTSPRAPYDDAPATEDWPTQVADSIERVVGTVRDKTTGPALTAAKFVVYGTFAALIAMVALVLFIIGALRLLNAYLPSAIFGERHMWAAYGILGTFLVVFGGLLWMRRRQPEQTPAYRR